MRANEINLSLTYFAEKYSQKVSYYDTEQIIKELYNFGKDSWIKSPLKYSNYLNWSNLPSETKMSSWLNKGLFELKELNPHRFISYQRAVYVGRVLLAMEDIEFGRNSKKKFDQYPIVKQWNGKDYLIDGNHRVVAALWSNRLLKCRCLESEIFFEVEPF